jgi:NADH-quinone oxidoreductase subunit F
MAGSGGVIVMDEDTDLVAVCARIMRFYAHESCGQCTPCREGTGWLARICTRLAKGEGRPGDVELCASIAHGIAGNTICPLGEAAAWPMLGFLTKFRGEFEAKIRKDLAPDRRQALTQPPLVQIRGTGYQGTALPRGRT